MRCFRRRHILPTVALLAAVVLVGGYLFSRSNYVGRKIVATARENLGTDISVDNHTLGLGSTSLRGFRLFEQGAGTDSQPILAADEVNLDVSVFGAVRGTAPKTISLRQARVVLRFNEKGDLLTQLPQSSGGRTGTMPAIHIESGQLTIRQEGRDDSIFVGIDITITSDAAEIQINGSVNDERWGEWRLTGAIPLAKDAKGQVTASTVRPQRVSPELLRTIPFVNPNAWKAVTLDGTTSARIDVDFDNANDRVSYRAVMLPTDTAVHIPSIGLRLSGALGEVIGEQAIVSLNDIRGKAAGGVVRVKSRMDFSRPQDDTLQFDAHLDHVDVRQLPPNWKVPPQIEGKLTGDLKFQVKIPLKGAVTATGNGKALLTDAKLNGRPTPQMELTLRTTRGGNFEFVDGSPPVRHEVLRPDDPGALPDPPIQKKEPANKASGFVPWLLQSIAKYIKPDNASNEDKAYLQFKVDFRDVDIAELLKGAGVSVPAKINGKASLQLQLSLPTTNPDDLKAYRLNGTIVSKRLTIDSLAIEDVGATLTYRDGRLKITNLKGRLPGLDVRQGGEVTGTAEVDVGGRYPYSAKLKLAKIDLANAAQLRNLIPLEIELAGEANIDAELSGTFNPTTFLTKGTGRVVKLRIDDAIADDLTFRWDSDATAFHLREAKATIFGGEINGSLKVPVRRDTAGTGSFKLANLDLGVLAKAAFAGTDLKLEGAANGVVRVSFPVVPDGRPREMTAEIDVQAPTLKVQVGENRIIPAKKLRGTISYVGGELVYRISAEAFGGEIAIEPRPKRKMPTKPEPKNDPGRLKFRRVQLSQLWSLFDLTNPPSELEAELSGDIPLTTDAAGHLVGTGSVRAERIRWGEREIANNANGSLRLSATEVVVDDVALALADGLVRASLAFHRLDSDRSVARINLTNVPAGRLFFALPALADRLDFRVDGRITTTIGREWRGAGVVTATRGKVFGVPVTDIRLPFDWVVVPKRNRGEVHLREATATAAGGQITSSAELNLFADLPPRLAGELQFRNLNVSQAIRAGERNVGTLPLTGRLDFSADQFRTSDDLTAKLKATIAESQPFSLPVLSAILPYVGVGLDTRTQISQGSVQATLGRGTWQIQQLTMSGPNIDVYADGTLTTTGRLNLSIAASSGAMRPSDIILKKLRAIPVALTQPLSRDSLSQLLGVIGNFVAYLEVTGTIDTPSVRLQALRTIGEDAVRFFALRFLGI